MAGYVVGTYACLRALTVFCRLRRLQHIVSACCARLLEQLESESEIKRGELSAMGAKLTTVNAERERLARECADLRERGEELEGEKATQLVQARKGCLVFMHIDMASGFS